MRLAVLAECYNTRTQLDVHLVALELEVLEVRCNCGKRFQGAEVMCAQIREVVLAKEEVLIGVF